MSARRPAPALLACVAPLRVEAAALRAGARGTSGVVVVRSGPGADRARRRAPALAATLPSGLSRPSVVIAGVCGALGPGSRPGDVVVADALATDRNPGAVSVTTAGEVAEQLRDAGVRVHVGPVVSAGRLVHGAQARRHLAELGAVDGRPAIAVDMESAWLYPAPWPGPVAVVRVIVDTPTDELVSLSTVPAGVRALVVLARCVPALARWAAATVPAHQPHSIPEPDRQTTVSAQLATDGRPRNVPCP